MRNIFKTSGKPMRIWLRHEANCSPNPFDILAIYALYQHVEDSSDE